MQTLMGFHHHAKVGSGIVFTEIDGIEFYQSEFQRVNEAAGRGNLYSEDNKTSQTSSKSKTKFHHL